MIVRNFSCGPKKNEVFLDVEAARLDRCALRWTRDGFGRFRRASPKICSDEPGPQEVLVPPCSSFRCFDFFW